MSLVAKKNRIPSIMLLVVLMMLCSCECSMAADTAGSGGFWSVLLSRNMWSVILGGLKTTVIIFFFALIESLCVSSLLTYLAISGKCQWFYKPMHWFVTSIRDVPSVALMMLFYYVIFAGEVNGIIVTIIAAGLYTSGAIVGIFKRSIDQVGKGQIEAGRALGLTTRQCYRYIVLPQAAKTMTPTLTGQVKIQLRITSYAGYVAQTDLIRAVFNVENIYSDMLAPLLIASLFYLIMAKSIVRVVAFITTKLFKYD